MASPRAGLARADALGVRAPGGRTLLEDVSFEVPLPARVAIMGANGAGKSVLLSALAGVVDHEGTLELPEPRAAVLQDPEGVFVAPTVFEEVAFALAPRRLDEHSERARVSAALGALELAPLADRDPATLSGGEQQRVHLAAAMVTAPRTLLLDEPREYLDPVAGAALERVLNELRPAPALIAVATHDAETALAADLVVVLRGGRVVASGPPDEVFRHPDLEAWGVGPPAALVLGRALVAAGRMAPPPPLGVAALAARLRREGGR